MVEDGDAFCPSTCHKCSVCNEMTEIFTELQNDYFFYPRTNVVSNQEYISYQPVLQRIFNSVINKGNRKDRIDRKVSQASWFGF